MFKFVPDAHGDGPRLVADTVLTLEQFEGIAKALGTPPIRARKSGFVAARKATKSEMVETRANGRRRPTPRARETSSSPTFRRNAPRCATTTAT